MTEPRAIAGEFADFKLVKTRSVAQIVIEVPIEEGELVVRMFGIPQPGKPVRLALARLNKESEVVPDTSSTDAERRHKNGAGDKKAWSDLPPAQQAGIRCAEKAFWKFLNEDGYGALGEKTDVVEDEAKAANYVRLICGVHSRADIGKDRSSLNKWRDLESAYQAWLHDPVSPEAERAA